MVHLNAHPDKTPRLLAIFDKYVMGGDGADLASFQETSQAHDQSEPAGRTISKLSAPLLQAWRGGWRHQTS